MVTRSTRARISKIEPVLRHRFYSPKAVKVAFVRFQETGELPNETALAQEVIRRAKAGYDPVYNAHGDIDYGATIKAALFTPRPAQNRRLHQLYAEAVHGPMFIKTIARHALRTIVDAGQDVTAALDMDEKLPNYGSVGLHFMGIPTRLAKPPYVEQARSLFKRCAELRSRLPHGDRRWFSALDTATEDFLAYGEVPADPLTLEALLALGETHTLMRHFGGEDVSALMTMFAQIEQDGTNAENLAALAKLAA